MADKLNFSESKFVKTSEEKEKIFLAAQLLVSFKQANPNSKSVAILEPNYFKEFRAGSMICFSDGYNSNILQLDENDNYLLFENIMALAKKVSRIKYSETQIANLVESHYFKEINTKGNNRWQSKDSRLLKCLLEIQEKGKMDDFVKLGQEITLEITSILKAIARTGEFGHLEWLENQGHTDKQVMRIINEGILSQISQNKLNHTALSDSEKRQQLIDEVLELNMPLPSEYTETFEEFITSKNNDESSPKEILALAREFLSSAK